jgi:DNA repair exonuclease SbcCD ATPase subunit
MKHISKTALITAASGTILLAAPFAAFADEVNVSADASAHTNITSLYAHFGAHGSSTKPHDGDMPNLKAMGDVKGMHMGSTTREDMGQKGFDNRQDKAGNAIDARIAAMQKAEARIDAAVKLSASEKAELKADIDKVIADLTALKAQIGSDTSTTSLKADASSITKAYRVYLLVLPQTAIAAASDRALAIAAQLDALEVKLEARISAAQAAGTDVTAMQASLTDFKAKVADAKSKATAAAAEVKNLSADNGDKATLTANATALKDARAKLEAARQDLKAAYADAKSIAGNGKGKGEVKADAKATASVK